MGASNEKATATGWIVDEVDGISSSLFLRAYWKISFQLEEKNTMVGSSSSSARIVLLKLETHLHRRR